MNKPLAALAFLVMGSTFLAGCGARAPVTKSHPHPTASPSSQPSSSPTSPSSSQIVGSRPPTSPPATTQTTSPVSLIKAWMQSATKGQGPNMPIGDGQNISAVQQQWGTGQSSAAGAGIYVTYARHQIAFGINQGDQIFDVRSYQSDLHGISRATLFDTLGPAPATRYADGTTIYLYPVQADYQVLWVFQGGAGHTGNTVNHVDVVWPQGTVNLMSQTQPNPSIAITQAPGVDGSYVGFRIQSAPAGYQLSELEWLSSTGSTIVNTLPQALSNAEHQSSGALFTASNDSYRLQYLASMAGQSGKIRLIYESPSGASIIGTSSTIVLK